MTLNSEREFIQQLKSRFTLREPVETGIGDDGAVLSSTSSRQVVVSDMLLDKVHFDLQEVSPQLAGRKSVAVNLSDLAAMACRPTAAFISLALPTATATDDQFLSLFYDGIQELADRFEFTVAGGDTNVWNGPFAVCVTMTGEPMFDRPLLRSTAKPGDLLVVTGPLGGSLCNGRHLTFEPRLEAARWFANSPATHAMMDISDGLSLDLARMMEASGAGAVVDAEKIPVHADVGDTETRQRILHAISDGEDFELLIAVSELPEEPPRGFDVIPIGRVTEASDGLQLRWKHAENEPLNPSGWQHF